MATLTSYVTDKIQLRWGSCERCKRRRSVKFFDPYSSITKATTRVVLAVEHINEILVDCSDCNTGAEEWRCFVNTAPLCTWDLIPTARKARGETFQARDHTAENERVRMFGNQFWNRWIQDPDRESADPDSATVDAACEETYQEALQLLQNRFPQIESFTDKTNVVVPLKQETKQETPESVKQEDA
jgi:hypothetical protein